MGPRAVVALALGVTGAGCTTVENEALPDPTAKLDEAAFRCKVEPVLVRDCSYEACHGNADAALRVYRMGGLRATPPKSDDELSAVLTDAEHHANFRSAAAFSIGIASPAQSWLLLKPLPESLGGYEHKGGAIYKSTADSDFVAIFDWLRGVSKCP